MMVLSTMKKDGVKPTEGDLLLHMHQLFDSNIWHSNGYLWEVGRHRKNETYIRKHARVLQHS